MAFSWKKAYKAISITVGSTLTKDRPISKLCDADDELRRNIDLVDNDMITANNRIYELEREIEELKKKTVSGVLNPLPTGGDRGQMLVKASNYDFDVKWGNQIYESLFNVRFTNTGYVVQNGLVVWRESSQYVYKTLSSTTFTSTGYVYVLFNAQTKGASILHSATRPELTTPVEDITVIAHVDVETNRVVYEHLGAVKYARD